MQSYYERLQEWSNAEAAKEDQPGVIEAGSSIRSINEPSNVVLDIAAEPCEQQAKRRRNARTSAGPRPLSASLANADVVPGTSACELHDTGAAAAAPQGRKQRATAATILSPYTSKGFGPDRSRRATMNAMGREAAGGGRSSVAGQPTHVQQSTSNTPLPIASGMAAAVSRPGVRSHVGKDIGMAVLAEEATPAACGSVLSGKGMCAVDGSVVHAPATSTERPVWTSTAGATTGGATARLERAATQKLQQQLDAKCDDLLTAHKLLKEAQVGYSVNTCTCSAHNKHKC